MNHQLFVIGILYPSQEEEKVFLKKNKIKIKFLFIIKEIFKLHIKIYKNILKKNIYITHQLCVIGILYHLHEGENIFSNKCLINQNKL